MQYPHSLSTHINTRAGQRNRERFIAHSTDTIANRFCPNRHMRQLSLITPSRIVVMCYLSPSRPFPFLRRPCSTAHDIRNSSSCSFHCVVQSWNRSYSIWSGIHLIIFLINYDPLQSARHNHPFPDIACSETCRQNDRRSPLLDSLFFLFFFFVITLQIQKKRRSACRCFADHAFATQNIIPGANYHFVLSVDFRRSRHAYQGRAITFPFNNVTRGTLSGRSFCDPPPLHLFSSLLFSATVRRICERLNVKQSVRLSSHHLCSQVLWALTLFGESVTISESISLAFG